MFSTLFFYKKRFKLFEDATNCASKNFCIVPVQDNTPFSLDREFAPRTSTTWRGQHHIQTTHDIPLRKPSALLHADYSVLIQCS